MKIWVYTVCFNEEHFVKNFLCAYSSAEVERIIVYDNYSTDKTVKVLRQDPRVEIRYFDSANEFRDDIHIQIKNNAWKEARGFADWCIVVDFDEVFCRAEPASGYEDAILSLNLNDPYKKGYTIIKPFGYNLISIDAPLGKTGHPFNYSKKGIYHWPMEKPCCFRPDKILEMNYSAGCHFAEPKGEVKILHSPEYKMLHFKCWNISLYLRKIERDAKRLSEINIKNGWGTHYLKPLTEHCQEFLNAYSASMPLFLIEKTDKLLM